MDSDDETLPKLSVKRNPNKYVEINYIEFIIKVIIYIRNLLIRKCFLLEWFLDMIYVL